MGTPTATVSVTLPNPVKAGSTIVAALSTFPPTDGTVQFTDSLGSTFTAAGGPRTAGSGNYDLRVQAAFNVAAGSDTVTVTIVGATVMSTMEFYVHEYSGVQSFETAVSAVGPGIEANVASGPLTTTGSNVLLFAMCLSGGTAVPGPAYTLRSNFNNNYSADLIVSAPGSYEATGTNVTGAEWVIIFSAFRGR